MGLNAIVAGGKQSKNDPINNRRYSFTFPKGKKKERKRKRNREKQKQDNHER